MPSDTGIPEGKKTGQTMADYPIPGGLFEQACNDLVESGFMMTWIDRHPMVSPPHVTEPSVINDKTPDMQAQPLARDETATIASDGIVDDEVLPAVADADIAHEDDIEEKEKPQRPALSNPLLEQNVSDLMPGIEPVSNAQAAKKRKAKYSCPGEGCKLNVWGKPDLNIICGECKTQLVAVQ